MTKFFVSLIVVTIMTAGAFCAMGQQKEGIYVDSKGIIRWEKTNKEAAFFGVNYTVPFAYGYRSHKALGIDIEDAIRKDVYHLARLGLNAFRVHVWDTEITDSAGNLIKNEHLRLFDFLIAELKKRGIKILVTPIAFWGNGYPEKDEQTPGFSAKYGKHQSVVNEHAIRAQENYMKQFYTHENPYTGLTYRDDPDIIATEINNEPQHSGSKEHVRSYVNRLAAAIRSTGWKKPVFYNISESPSYADAVANAEIDGVSFQWYPSGLVANYTLKGNYLPHVDRYSIPFDTIPAFSGKARMVYEFDAGDIQQPIMYPAMARSFRTAGFQWATQFAYDPMATAYANTEYQTHYLNLAYTPSKAISLLIAGKVFQKVPLSKSYGTYPQSNVFESFRLDYDRSLSEMNTDEEFYYSNSTSSKPVALSKLRHVAGVGNSPVVRYEGSGAYFLDKVGKGAWRLEVMPDAVLIADPFDRASPRKEVTRIEWKNRAMQIFLPELGADFQIKGVNEGNTYSSVAGQHKFVASPGTYLLLEKGKSEKKLSLPDHIGAVSLREFVAPKQLRQDIAILHEPHAEITEGQPLQLKAVLAGADSSTKVVLYLQQLAGESKVLTMHATAGAEYSCEIPAGFLKSGLLQYRIAVNTGKEQMVFPGNHRGDPWAWDNYRHETWDVLVVPAANPLEIYSATRDRSLRTIPHWDTNISTGYTASEEPGKLVYNTYTTKLPKDHIIGFQKYIADELSGRQSELQGFSAISLKAASTTGVPVELKVSLVNKEGQAYSARAQLSNELSVFSLPLKDFKPDSALLLPRPYPGFHPLKFMPREAMPLDLRSVETLQISVGTELKDPADLKALGFCIESVQLNKQN